MTHNTKEEHRYPVEFMYVDENGDYQLIPHVKEWLHHQLQKAQKEEWERCIKVLDHNHTSCPIKETCIGYQNAQADLINNPPNHSELDQLNK